MRARSALPTASKRLAITPAPDPRFAATRALATRLTTALAADPRRAAMLATGPRFAITPAVGPRLAAMPVTGAGLAVARGIGRTLAIAPAAGPRLATLASGARLALTRAIGRTLAIALAVALAGCGVGTSGVISGLPAPSGPVGPPVTATLYLISTTGPVRVRRAVIPGQSTADLLGLLVAGPDAQERASGLRTAVPGSAVPFQVNAEPNGQITVTTAISPDQLPEPAVTQIVDTVCAAEADANTGRQGPVTLLGRGHALRARNCPSTG